DLGHEEHPVPPALEAPTEPVLGPAVPVLPAVVEKGDAGIDGLVDEADGLLHRLEVAEVAAAEPQRRHLDAGSAEWPLRDCALVRHDNLLFPSRASKGRPVSGSILRRTSLEYAVSTTSAVGRAVAANRCPPRAEPSRRPRTTWTWKNGSLLYRARLPVS